MNPAATLHLFFREEAIGSMRDIAGIVGEHPTQYRRYVSGEREAPLSKLHGYCERWAESGRPAVELVVSRWGARAVRASVVPGAVRRWLKPVGGAR